MAAENEMSDIRTMCKSQAGSKQLKHLDVKTSDRFRISTIKTKMVSNVFGEGQTPCSVNRVK